MTGETTPAIPFTPRALPEGERVQWREVEGALDRAIRVLEHEDPRLATTAAELVHAREQLRELYRRRYEAQS
ncbi:hypothetical protein [Halorhodospira neutriphila]|uniref:Uncharacterized protein n=1 Tax=Halorhodospira neutriphila TaxID=168379 RepID=A0ABS1E4K7_9GAMM|nr:hypothetical protein [Halorhodospira neutriphila]MBK1725695.1 hypothetical protein [Halorhodospira neutriphila]